MVELIQKIFKTLRRVSPRGLEGLSREPFEEKLSQFFVSKLFFKKSDIFPCLHLWREYPRRCLAGDGLVGSLLSSHFLHPGFCTFSTFTSGPLLIILFSSFSSLHSRFFHPLFCIWHWHDNQEMGCFSFSYKSGYQDCSTLGKKYFPPI